MFRLSCGAQAGWIADQLPHDDRGSGSHGRRNTCKISCDGVSTRSVLLPEEAALWQPIDAIGAAIKAEFAALEDWPQRVDHLITIGRRSKGIAPEDRLESDRVTGC